MFVNSVAERKQKLAPLLGLRETPLPKNATFVDTVAARIREKRNTLFLPERGAGKMSALCG
jgi:hypothetical protein